LKVTTDNINPLSLSLYNFPKRKEASYSGVLEFRLLQR
jgi:hypothetical protein